MEPQIVKPPTDVRQGETNTGLRYMLGFGLLLVIAAFAVVWFVHPW
ncbi:MAG: hypothetical protein KGM42_11925 [Hyphomicrobiales bacterium]|nr:hypothetical protein [Hyphomicrobiales bacterium]